MIRFIIEPYVHRDRTTGTPYYFTTATSTKSGRKLTWLEPAGNVRAHIAEAYEGTGQDTFWPFMYETSEIPILWREYLRRSTQINEHPTAANIRGLHRRARP